jgi:hypothetical protein
MSIAALTMLQEPLSAEELNITCPDNILDVCSDDGQNYATIANIGLAKANDPDAIVVSNAPTDGHYLIGTTLVTWTATNATTGATATCTQSVTVKDCQAGDKTEDLSITCPPDIVDVCPDRVVLGEATSNDEAAVITNDAPEVFSIGTTTVTWTATNATTGATATCTQSVTVKDCQAGDETEDLSITCPPDLLDICADEGQNFATIADIGLAETNDPDAKVISSAPANNQYPVGENTVIWTATNSTGSFVTCAQTITVVDCTAPIITCQPAVEVCIDEGVDIASIDSLEKPVVDDSTATITGEPAELVVGANTVTWTATDEAGNAASCTQTVIVKDCAAPEIICPADITNCTDNGKDYATIKDIGTPEVSDPDAKVTNDAPNNNHYPIGDNVVTWTATDAAGNSATCVQIVNVEDCQVEEQSTAMLVGEELTIEPPDEIDVCADGGKDYATIKDIGTPFVSDPEAKVTSDAPNSGHYPVGSTTVTWTATDAAGNTADCEQQIQVDDCEAPVISCPPAIEICTDEGMDYATIADLGTPNVNDQTAVVSNDGPGQYEIGQTTVTWSAIDEAGNEGLCEQLVIVKDCNAAQIPGVEIGNPDVPTVEIGESPA